jgi:predicted esterase
VLERGMPRFFRRHAEGVFDLEDLRRRTHELADFVENAAAAYGFDRARLFAVGFSNGANIATSLLLLRPGLLAGAVLFSPMFPLEPEPRPGLARVPVWVAAGRGDLIAPPDRAERLVGLLRECGAEVSLFWEPGGHGIDPEAVAAAREWLARH